ncbi:sulfite exporter TauE/SafE family protein [Streptococcus caviae]|uniref:sulfite exporter TauE/SafE family protein n=1 Tax=Streptococcus sp. 'caviae' TaxID=1915004 RepID=UPI00094B8632|nr:sulfite exporter TauE/SafE family protein [Streptococcus sp. 'caviae']OLN82993.1 sulfite transporter TauE/SafE [Streptococcus sp. 'caviae']
MEIILYTLVVFIATALGATSGAGGGAIIKPVFDLIGIDNVTVIGMYSTIAVFAMCLSSIYKHSKSGVKFEKNILYGLSLGSLLGGLLGELVFKNVTQEISNARVTLVQSVLLFFVLLSVFIFTRCNERFPKYKLTNLLVIFLVGMLVGALSVFLGIGGGPLNVIVLVGFMSYNTKDSAPYSIAMIFFAQIPKIIKMVMVSPPETFRWGLVPLIIAAAILGGSVGTSINRQFSDKHVNYIYSCMMLALLVLCLYNVISNVG